MIHDTKTGFGQSVIRTDLCVVGAGVAGIALAFPFLGTRIRVTLVEAGGYRHTRDAADSLRGDLLGSGVHPPAHLYRRRGLGGATQIWGGRCVPFEAWEFGDRPWLGLRGWPVNYAEMKTYYEQAQHFCGVGAAEWNAARALPDGMRPMLEGLPEDELTTESVEMMAPRRFGSFYRQVLAEASNIHVITHATITAIRLDIGGRRVLYLTGKSSNGEPLVLLARAFVLACGGLDTPRLLLGSRDLMPDGVGNGFNQVGRNYMCHLAATTACYQPSDSARLFNGYEFSSSGTPLRRRLAVRPQTQERRGIGAAIARFHHPEPGDPSHRNSVLSALCLARALLPPEYRTRLRPRGKARPVAHLKNMITGWPELATFAVNVAAKRKQLPSLVLPHPRAGYTLDLHIEQLPNPESRVLLSDRADALGVPRIAISWQYTERDLNTAVETVRVIAAAIDKGRLGQLRWSEHQVREDVIRAGAYGGHHLGTARMSLRPRDGVVDPTCRVHGIENLYVTGGAVFPSSGQANPTLTIIALSLRLGALLKSRLTETGDLPMAEQAALSEAHAA